MHMLLQLTGRNLTAILQFLGWTFAIQTWCSGAVLYHVDGGAPFQSHPSGGGNFNNLLDMS